MGRQVAERDDAAAFRALFDDESAFRAWYEVALPRVYGYLFNRCGGVRSIAEELTQEAFTEAIRHRGAFDGRSDPITWVISIARHKLADHARRLHRDARRHLRLVSGFAEDDTGTDTDTRMLDRDAVLRALSVLPPLQRAAVVLYYLDDLSTGEVARELGKSESAVESLLARGRDGLRRALSNDTEPDHA